MQKRSGTARVGRTFGPSDFREYKTQKQTVQKFTTQMKAYNEKEIRKKKMLEKEWVERQDTSKMNRRS
jgi:hypothetical protein